MPKPRTSIVKPGDIFITYTAKYGIIALLYLKWKYPNDCIVVSTGPIANLAEHRISDLADLKYLEFELRYSNKKYEFRFAPDFIYNFTHCLNKSSARFIVLPLILSAYTLGNRAHVNILIYDKHTKEMERFEPHGYNYDYDTEMPKIDREVQIFFDEAFPNVVKKVIPPLDFCPKANVQVLEAYEFGQLHDQKGFCYAWSIWYADTRLSNPNKTREQIVRMGIDKIKTDYGNFHQFIRSYAAFFTEMDKKLGPINEYEKVYAEHPMNYD